MYSYESPLLNTTSSKEDIVQNLVNNQYYLSTDIDTYSISSLQLNSSQAFFTNQDFVWILFSDNKLGFLSLPQQISNSECKFTSGIRYLKNKQNDCYVTSTNIDNECNGPSVTSLSLEYFLNGFQIVKVSNMPFAEIL